MKAINWMEQNQRNILKETQEQSSMSSEPNEVILIRLLIHLQILLKVQWQSK
jgi:hypothetical protein